MDINASTASQAYATAKPAAAGTQGAAQSGQTLPVSQTTQTRQVTVDATSSSPAFVLDISTQVLKVEKLSDMSAEDQQYWLDQRQQFIDRFEAFGRSTGKEGLGSALAGKDITFGQEDGTSKILRADGYVVTTRDNLTAGQQSALTRHYAEVDADHAAENAAGAAASGSAVTTANTTVAEAPSAPAPATEKSAAVPFDSSRYANLPGYSEAKLSDLSTEEQQSLLKVREQLKSIYAVRGESFNNNAITTSPSGLVTILTTDDRVITYQQDTRYRLTPEQIAQRQAADEQNRRETEAQMAAQAEWEKKWGVGAKVSSDTQMSKGELAVAEDVALTEHMLNTFRMDISTVNGLNWSIANYQKQLDEDGVDPRSSTAAKLRERMDTAKAEVDKLVARLARKQDVFQSSFGYDLVGNMFEQTADGRYREGTYTLSKGTGGNGAIKVDSAEGIMVSANGGAFTYDFKRVVAANPGPSPIQTESREERARRVQNMS